MALAIPQELEDFAKEYHVQGLTAPTLKALKEKKYQLDKAKEFLKFRERIQKELLNHRVITNNKFTKWFSRAELTTGQTKAFIIQFSVFSNLFLVAQLKKMINADTLDAMRASKEILANEIGVIFNSPRKTKRVVSDADQEGDPELVSTEGTIEGGKFRFQAAHFEWLLRIAEKLGIGFSDLGHRKHGTKSTLFFCDELVRLYGSDDYATSQAASYAVENWAAAGFWKELIQGLTTYKKKYCPSMPLAFFTWHDRLEDQHALHTQEELEEYFFTRKFDQNAFIKYGNEMMDGIAVFWDGLDEQRKQLKG